MESSEGVTNNGCDNGSSNTVAIKNESELASKQVKLPVANEEAACKSQIADVTNVSEGKDELNDEEEKVGENHSLSPKHQTNAEPQKPEKTKGVEFSDADEEQDGALPCSQQDMFDSEPQSPGIVTCTAENPVAEERPEEFIKTDRMEVDKFPMKEGRAFKRLHEENCSDVQTDKDVEGSLAKKPRHSVEIVFERPLSQEAHNVSATPSMNVSEDFLDLTGGTEESVHLHYSPSPEYDIPESQVDSCVDYRQPSMSTVVLASDDDEEEETAAEKTALAEADTQVETNIQVEPDTEVETDTQMPPMELDIMAKENGEKLDTISKSPHPERQANSTPELSIIINSTASTNKQDSETASSSTLQISSATKDYESTATKDDESTTTKDDENTATKDVESTGAKDDRNLATKEDENTVLPHESTSPAQEAKLEVPTYPMPKAAVFVHSSPYNDNIPVPQYESLSSSLERHTPSPLIQGGCSTKIRTSISAIEHSDRILTVTKNMLVQMQVCVHYREGSKEVVCYEITQSDIVEEATHHYTSGTTGDDSKSTSPGSVTSVGPFPLIPRASTTSSSSGSSLTTAANLATSHSNKRLNAGVEVLNLDLLAATVRQVGTEPLPVPSAIFASRKPRSVIPIATSDKSTTTTSDFKEGTGNKQTVITPNVIQEMEDVKTPALVHKTEVKDQSTPRTANKRGRARVTSSKGRPRNRRKAPDQPSPLVTEPLTWGTEDACRFKPMLHPGASAFARWTDKRYYPGKLTEKQRDDRWLVSFDDGSVKTLKEDFVIPVETLTKGQLVYATLPDGTCADGIIAALVVQDNEEQYYVELDDGREVVVPRRDIFLTEDQARLLLEGATLTIAAPSTPGRLADVDLNNLITGKRVRTPTHSSSGPATPRGAGPSGNVFPNKVSRSSSPSDRGSVSGGGGDELVCIGGIEPESEGPKVVPLATGSTRGKGKATTKGKGKALFATANILKDSAELDETLGPIPPKGSKMFEGMIFLLTSVDFDYNKMYEKKQDICSDSEGEKEFSNYLFVKERLRLQLEAGGGTVLESLDDVPMDRLRDTVLIANRPCLTAKYIRCLAKAVKIVNHDYVIQMAKGNLCTPNAFGLPLGWSLLDGRYVGNAAELGSVLRTRKGGSRQLLTRKKLVLVHETPQFLAFWQKVLSDLGAKTSTYSPNEAIAAETELKSADAIISDSSCPPHIQERAREWRKPLVSTTWITQCLIHREVVPFNVLPNFAFDFSD